MLSEQNNLIRVLLVEQ